MKICCDVLGKHQCILNIDDVLRFFSLLSFCLGLLRSAYVPLIMQRPRFIVFSGASWSTKSKKVFILAAGGVTSMW